VSEHTFMDRLRGRHQWQLTNDSFYYFRAGGSAELRYRCTVCGLLKTQRWNGAYEEGRELTDEERKALGPYL
jgi:hypothetical protein